MSKSDTKLPDPHEVWVSVLNPLADLHRVAHEVVTPEIPLLLSGWLRLLLEEQYGGHASAEKRLDATFPEDGAIRILNIKPESARRADMPDMAGEFAAVHCSWVQEGMDSLSQRVWNALHNEWYIARIRPVLETWSSAVIDGDHRARK